MHAQCRRILSMKLTLPVLMIFFLCILSCSLEDQPVFLQYRRPSSIPSDSVLVQMPKGGVWQHCEVRTESGTIYCQIYNWKGRALYNEQFLPYDGGPAPTAKDLKIPQFVPNVSPDWVCLQNGRILMPASRFDQLKNFLTNGVGGQTTK